jgi:hypothetical protein
MEGLQHAWQTPFYVLAMVLRFIGLAPDPQPILAVGRKRAAELAKATYPVWDYYARQYLHVHPDQQVNVSIGVTVLDAIGIGPDLVEAIYASRANAAKAAAAPGPAGPPPASAGQNA